MIEIKDNRKSNNISINPCIRCGTERIVAKRWKETITTDSGVVQTIEYTEMRCPDKECQKILNKQLLEQKEKRDEIRNKKSMELAKRKIQRLSVK